MNINSQTNDECGKKETTENELNGNSLDKNKNVAKKKQRNCMQS